MELSWVPLLLTILPWMAKTKGKLFKETQVWKKLRSDWEHLIKLIIPNKVDPSNEILKNCAFGLISTDLHYIGCFKDSDPRDLPQRVHTPKLNARTCVKKCKELEFKYAGLQFSYLCFCGNTYGRYGELPEDKCSSECKSKRDSFCGGHWSNSVYKTGEF